MPVVGTQQSPIRIENEVSIRVPSNFPSLKIGYDRSLCGKFKGDNFVFDIAYNPDQSEIVAGKTVAFDKNTWIIRKIHIHQPAEHVFEESDPFPYECHLLHSLAGDPKGRGPKLVIASFFDVPTPKHKPTGKKLAAMKNADRSSLIELNRKLRDYISNDDDPTVCKAEHATPIDPRHFLPTQAQQNRWYHYEGSLTSDPYTEDVTWFVMPDESFIEADEISEIGKCAEQPARAAHPLDRRFVLRSF